MSDREFKGWANSKMTDWWHEACAQHDFWCQVAIAALLQHNAEYDGDGHWSELCANVHDRCTLHGEGR